MHISDGTTNVGDYAFYGCTSLENVRLPETLTAVGDYAFKGASALRSITLGSGVTQIGQQAFYGCNALTIYCGAQAAPEDWHDLWNVSFRPVFWGCTIADGAVMRIAGDALVENGVAIGGISAPYRQGYTFAGWSTSSDGGAQIAAGELADALQGSLLYAVWQLQ